MSKPHAYLYRYVQTINKRLTKFQKDRYTVRWVALTEYPKAKNSKVKKKKKKKINKNKEKLTIFPRHMRIWMVKKKGRKVAPTKFPLISSTNGRTDRKAYFNSLLLTSAEKKSTSIVFVSLFDSLRPINNLSVLKGRVFLGWTSTKLGLMFLLKDTTQWRRCVPALLLQLTEGISCYQIMRFYMFCKKWKIIRSTRI